MNRVTLALAEHLHAHGGEIRTNCHVEKILGNAERATAVRLTNGEEIPVGQLIVSKGSEWFHWLAERMMEREKLAPPVPAYVAHRTWRETRGR